MNLENEPPSRQPTNNFPQKTDKKVDEPTPPQAMDFLSQNADMKVEDKPDTHQTMDCLSSKTDKEVEDDQTPSQATDFSSKKTDKKLEDGPTLSQATYFVSQKTDKKKEDGPTSSQATYFVSQKTDKKIEDEPTPSTSTHDFHSVQRICKRKQRRGELSFKPYILRLKKIVTPDMELSSNTLEDLDNLISNVYEMYCSEFQQLLRHTKKKTLSAKDVESATQLCLLGKRKDNAMIFANYITIFQEELKKNPTTSQEV